MPSARHEILVEIFRQHPELLEELLGARYPLVVPKSKARFVVEEPNFQAIHNLEADLVLTVEVGDEVLRALVFEVQLAENPRKPPAWVLYQASAHRRYACPSFVVVLALDRAVAKWAAGPFDTGQTVLRPIVVGPDAIPVVTEPRRAQRNIELAVLSGIAHASQPEGEAVGAAVWHALDRSEGEDNDWYWDILLHSMDDDARRRLVMRLSNYRPQSEWGKRIFAEGRQDGEAAGQRAALRESLLLALSVRGLSLAPSQRQAIDACRDLDQLRLWLRRALTATNADELFER